ncbi:MAG: HNH endonuclease signature motif containing protein [Candidatus Paceibacterota bacterium]|jgi:hypothetical protein
MNKKISIFFVSLALISSNVVFATYGIQTKTSNCVGNQTLPDSACSPGAVLTTDIKVICKTGYTKTVRNVTETTKKKVFKEYGIPYSQRSNYEVDHIISLELGGSNDISNLYPESYTIKDNARIKDKFENYLHKQVCGGKMDIVEAQRQISSDWLSYYQIEVLGVTTKTVVQPKTTTSNVVPVATTVVTSVILAPKENSIVNTTVSTSNTEVKKSSTGICHAKGTRYYNATLKYTSFASINDCLNSGGRLPK